MRHLQSSLGALAFGMMALTPSLASAEEFATFKGHGGPIMGLEVLGNGVLASASFDNSVGLWRAGRPQWLDGHNAAVTAIAPDGQGGVITGGDDFRVLHWRAGTAHQIGLHKGKVTSLSVDPNGRFVAAGSWDGDIMLWPLAGTGADPVKLPYAGAGVNAVTLSADGNVLFAATSKGVVQRYELSKLDAPRPLVRHGFGVNRLVAGPDWLAYGAVDGGTRVIDAQNGTELADFTLERRPILSMRWHADTGQLAVGDGEGYIMIIDTNNWSIARDFRAMRRGPVWALAFSENGKVIHAGGIDDVIYAWPVALLDSFDPAGGSTRSFLRDAASMPNGERQFMRKCSICHALDSDPSRKAGPSLWGVFGRRAGTLPDYRYSDTLNRSDIVWTETTIDALFDLGPDHYIPGSKMPMQVIAEPRDRADLIDFLKTATQEN